MLGVSLKGFHVKFRILVLICFLFRSDICIAAIIPSFSLKHSSTKATHIVVATEGDVIDGSLEIIESWKGDLQKHERIIIPELALFSSLESRRIDSFSKKQGFVGGSRMILFLVKSEAFSEAKSQMDKNAKISTKIRWLPASHPEYRPVYAGGNELRDNVGRFKISVAWIENGELYAFVQLFNPGPLRLTRLNGMTEEKIRSKCATYIDNASPYEKAAAITDPEKRAKELLPFVTNKNEEFRQIERAYNALGECGIHALPYLRDQLRDDKFLRWHCLAIKELAQAGGQKSGMELLRILQGEFAFVKEHYSTIIDLRWNDLPVNTRYHIINLEQAIKALNWLRYSDANQAILNILQYWKDNRLSPWGIESACNSFIKETKR